MRSDGTFVIPREAFMRAWCDGTLKFEVITLPLVESDPDCFAPDGDPKAAARWADDGGRADG